MREMCETPNGKLLFLSLSPSLTLPCHVSSSKKPRSLSLLSCEPEELEDSQAGERAAMARVQFRRAARFQRRQLCSREQRFLVRKAGRCGARTCAACPATSRWTAPTPQISNHKKDSSHAPAPLTTLPVFYSAASTSIQPPKNILYAHM